jgi:hypothetical protein
MASLELSPLTEHLEDNEIEELKSHLTDADVASIDLDEEGDVIPIEQEFDDDVFIDFFDQLDANDVACDVYIPVEFEEVFEIGERKIGSAFSLLIVLASMKEDMFVDDEEAEQEETEEAVEDVDDELEEFDDYSDEDEEFAADDDSSSIEVKDEQMRQVWRSLNRGAKLAISRRLALFVHD